MTASGEMTLFVTVEKWTLIQPLNSCWDTIDHFHFVKKTETNLYHNVADIVAIPGRQSSIVMA